MCSSLDNFQEQFFSFLWVSGIELGYSLAEAPLHTEASQHPVVPAWVKGTI